MKKIYISAAIILGIIALVAYLKTGSSDNMTGSPTYIFKDNLSCQFKSSTDKNNSNRTVTFIHLTGNSPEVMYGGSLGVTEYLTKKQEDGQSVTLESVASDGSVDTFVINKGTGTFTNSSVLNSSYNVPPSSGWGACD